MISRLFSCYLVSRLSPADKSKNILPIIAITVANKNNRNTLPQAKI